MKNKTLTNVLLAIMGLLIVAVIVERVLIIQKNTVPGIAQLISLVFTGIYGFWLYKKPHGNMLKYAMLLFALSNILSASLILIAAGTKFEIVRLIASAAVCYCAGRLDRIEQNKFILPVIGVAFLVVSIYWARVYILRSGTTIFSVFGRFNFTINYLTLMMAYFIRYKEHKEAGLMDAPKK